MTFDYRKLMTGFKSYGLKRKLSHEEADDFASQAVLWLLEGKYKIGRAHV